MTVLQLQRKPRMNSQKKKHLRYVMAIWISCTALLVALQSIPFGNSCACEAVVHYVFCPECHPGGYNCTAKKFFPFGRFGHIVQAEITVV